MKTYHRHIGIYGICKKDNEILIVEKVRGPYKNRYDLPGGSIEENETILEAIRREFHEETGFDIEVIENLGFTEYVIPYSIGNRNYIQHVALFLEVNIISQWHEANPSDDTSGSRWVSIESLNSSNSSPLVMTAFKLYRNK